MDLTLPIKQEEYNLIAGCINNERWAQKKLYEDNYPAMMTLSMRYAGNNDDALDINQAELVYVIASDDLTFERWCNKALSY